MGLSCPAPEAITCSHYPAHTEPTMLANRVPSIDDINVYVVGIFMYNYVTKKLPHIFENYFQRNKDVHDLNACQADDSADVITMTS